MVAEDGQQKDDVGGQHQSHVEHLHKKVLEGCCYMTVELGHFFQESLKICTKQQA
jgi:hypothetical protein